MKQKVIPQMKVESGDDLILSEHQSHPQSNHEMVHNFFFRFFYNNKIKGIVMKHKSSC